MRISDWSSDVCSSDLLLGDQCGAHTVPYIEVRNPSAQIEHEATTSKISDDQLFYAMQRGLDQEAAVSLIVNGFAREEIGRACVGKEGVSTCRSRWSPYN